MCGRYANFRSDTELRAVFGVAEAVGEPLEPSWNVAPTQPVRAVLERSPRGEPGAAPVRQLRSLRWGLVPSWATDPKIGARLINARVETITEKSAFKTAASRRRCLLPADGYYEWSTLDGERGVHYLARPDGGGLAMAGLYEVWSAGPDAPLLWTAAIVTTTATDGLGHIHDRSPVLVEEPDWSRWLDPLTGGEAVADLLGPPEPGALVSRPVAGTVGDVRANGPHLLDPPRPAAQSALW